MNEIFGCSLCRVRLNQTAKHTATWVNAKEYGVISGVNIDQAPILQDIIDNNDYIFIPDGEYYFSRILIQSSNKKIVFGENVKLKSNLNLNDARIGHIDIRGEQTNISYPILQDVEELTNRIYINSNGVANFSEGDVFEIEQDRPRTGSSLVENEQEHRQQNSYAILTVKSVNASTGMIETYETIPYDFYTIHNPYIVKINAVKNIEIIGTSTDYDRMGVRGHGNFFNVTYAYNVTIKGFNCINGAGKGVETYRANRFLISDLTYRNPSLIASAKGDGIVIVRSGYGVIDNCYFYNSGRGIDFSVAWNCLVRDCTGFQAPFTTHGILSKYITFRGCTVHGRDVSDDNFRAFTVGNGDYMFDEYITFENCQSYGGYYGLHTLEGSKHIYVNDCRFYNHIIGAPIRDGENIYINNCTFIECHSDISFNNITDSKISGCKMYSTKNLESGPGTIGISGNSKNIEINDISATKNKNVITNIRSDYTSANISINNSTFNNLKSGENRLNANGMNIFNCEFSDVIQLLGQENVIVRNSKFPTWYITSLTQPVKNFIVIDNIVTGRNGSPLTNITTDENENIFNERNIWMFTL